jgi:glycosyltransferase involved in cell wall biosynthesis
MRIAHTVSSLKGGGMEHFVVRLAALQRRLGHETLIVSLAGGPLADACAAEGLDVYVAGGNKLLRVLGVTAAIARFGPDIVHAHNPTSLHYAAIGKVAARAKLVVTDHAQTRGVVRVPTPLEWRLADAVVAVSQKTADESVAIGAPQPVRVIHNGVNPKPPSRPRAAVRAALEIGDDAIVVVHTAGFVRVKAHDVMLRALARVEARAPLLALLAGDGETRPAMEALAKELGLIDRKDGEPANGRGRARVRFLGFRSDVPDLLGAADVFALPSRNEGLPLSVLEAMAEGLPVVATPVGGVPELVRDGTDGLLVPVEDDAALATAIARLADDAGLRAAMGAAGRDRARGEFSFDRMTERYERLYGSLLR